MKNKIIIAVSGKIGAGKTTFSNFLNSDFTENLKLKVKFLNFADTLKNICYLLTGYKGLTQEEKNIFLPIWGMTVGEFLQKLGTDVMRNNLDQNVWVKSIVVAIEQDTESDIFIIGDCRFPNEADFIKDYGGYTVRLEGDPANVRKNSKRDLNHISETALDNYQNWDYKNLNDKGLEELQKFSKNVVDRIFFKHIL